MGAERILSAAAFLAACAASAAWIFAEPYGPDVSLVDANGGHVYGLLVVPVAIAAAPLLTPRHAHAATVAAAWLLVGFAFIAGFSIGNLYLPAAALMALAGWAGARARRSEQPSPA